MVGRTVFGPKVVQRKFWRHSAEIRLRRHANVSLIVFGAFTSNVACVAKAKRSKMKRIKLQFFNAQHQDEK